MRLGVLGGSFDPPHLGHLILAQEAMARLELRGVEFVPAGLQPLKAQAGGRREAAGERKLAPVGRASLASDRVAMTRLAIEDNPAFRLSLVDADRPGPSYTVDTLRLLRQQIQPEAELYFLIGMDSLEELTEWKSPELLAELGHVVVAPRPGRPRKVPRAIASALPGLVERLTLLPGPGVDISSTELRRRVRAGEPIRYLVPAAVEAYILSRGLYGGSTGSP